MLHTWDAMSDSTTEKSPTETETAYEYRGIPIHFVERKTYHWHSPFSEGYDDRTPEEVIDRAIAEHSPIYRASVIVSMFVGAPFRHVNATRYGTGPNEKYEIGDADQKGTNHPRTKADLAENFKMYRATPENMEVVNDLYCDTDPDGFTGRWEKAKLHFAGKEIAPDEIEWVQVCTD